MQLASRKDIVRDYELNEEQCEWKRLSIELERQKNNSSSSKKSPNENQPEWLEKVDDGLQWAASPGVPRLTGIGLTRIHYKDGEKEENLSHASVSIELGKVYAIIGESGSGKTTLLQALCGFNKANDGTVYFDLVDCYENKDSRRLFAYLPQDDVLHPDLTIIEELKYAAKLRCPAAMGADEREELIAKLLKDLRLMQQVDVYNKTIKSLSGGQRKRVAIAVALLSDPKVLFLDEPTSPLDPGMKSDFVTDVLRPLAKSGKAIVFVTHDFAPLSQVDELIWVHKGKVTYRGSLQSMRNDFEAKDADELAKKIYDEDNVEGNILEAAHGCLLRPGQSLPHPQGSILEASQTLSDAPHVPPLRSAWSQFATCLGRNIKLLKSDPSTAVFLIMPVLIAVLLGLVVNSDLYENFSFTKSILFAYATGCFFIGIFDSIQTYSNREMRKVDSFHGLSIGALVASDIVVLTLLCLVQSALTCFMFFSIAGLPQYTVFISPGWAMFAVSFLCCESAMLLGLLVSALFKNSTSVAPVLVLVQIVFSGLIFTLSGVTEKISYLVTCKWAVNSFGSVADLNSLDSKAMPMDNLGSAIAAGVNFDDEQGLDSYRVFLWNGDNPQFDPNVTTYLQGIIGMLILCFITVVVLYLVLRFQTRTDEAQHHPWLATKAFVQRYANGISVSLEVIVLLGIVLYGATSGIAAAVPGFINELGDFIASLNSNLINALGQAYSDFCDIFID